MKIPKEAVEKEELGNGRREFSKVYNICFYSEVLVSQSFAETEKKQYTIFNVLLHQCYIYIEKIYNS